MSFNIKSEGLCVTCFFEIFRRGPSSRFVPPVMNREENEEYVVHPELSFSDIHVIVQSTKLRNLVLNAFFFPLLQDLMM